MNRFQQYFILIPLSLLVILTVIAILAANLGVFGQAAISSTLAKWGPAGALAEIIGLYIFLAKMIFTKKSSTKYSLLITSPKSMPDFDVLKIDWDMNKCYILSSKFREKVKFVPALGGNTLRVHLPDKVIDILNDNFEEPIELTLKDKKGNEWAVKPFYLFENIQRLCISGDEKRIIADYGDDL